MTVPEHISLISRAALFSLVAIGGPTTFMGLTTYALNLAEGAFLGEPQVAPMSSNKAICAYSQDSGWQLIRAAEAPTTS